MSTTPSDAEIRAALYYAVGVASEGGRQSFTMVVAGDNRSTALLEPAGNSGYSIGTLQTDLGQRYQPDVEGGVNVPRDLVEATQAWALAYAPEQAFPDEASIGTAIADFGRMGRDIERDEFRDVDAEALGRVNAFLGSEHGVAWVHARDSAQVDRVMSEAITPLQATPAYQTMSAENQLQAAVIAGKLFNQHEVNGGRLIREMTNGRIDSLAEVDQFVNSLMDGRNDFYQTGKDHARHGAEVAQGLRDAPAETAMGRVWADVQSDPVRLPVLAERDLPASGVDRSHQVLRELALDPERGADLVDAANRGAQQSFGRAPAEGGGAMVAGDTGALWGSRGDVQVFRVGQWESLYHALVQRIGDRSNHELHLVGDGRTESLLRVDASLPSLRPNAAEQAERDRVNEGRLTDLEAQSMLRHGGFTDDHDQPIVSDGDFGPRSRQALMKFQAAEGLPVDGELDAQSRLRLAVWQSDLIAQNRPALPESTERAIGELGHPLHGRYLEARAGLAPHAEALGLDDAQSRQAAETLAVAAAAAGHVRVGSLRVGSDGSSVQMAPVPGAPADVGEISLRRTQLLGEDALPTPQRRSEAPAAVPAAPIETPARAAPVEQAELPTLGSTRGAVDAMEQSRGRTFDANSEKLTQAAALAGYAAGMDRIDHAVISTHKRDGQTIVGENLIVVQGALDDPAHVRASVRIDEALARTPAEHSQKMTEAQEQRQGLEARLATPLPAQRDPSQPDAPSGPRLS